MVRASPSYFIGFIFAGTFGTVFLTMVGASLVTEYSAFPNAPDALAIVAGLALFGVLLFIRGRRAHFPKLPRR